MADSTAVVLVFDDEKAAEKLFNTVQETLQTAAFPIDDAAVAVYKQSGEVNIKQFIHPLSANGFDAQLWEFLIRTMLSGWGNHIDDWPIEKFQQLFRPGTSAFFCLIEPYASREIIIRLRQFRGDLIYAGFSEEQRAILRSAASRNR